MGQNFSLQIFQIINDIHIGLGSGVLGVLLLLRNGMHSQAAKTFVMTSLTFASLRYAFLYSEISQASANKIIFITGCDSGLGFSLAQHACEMGFSVFAGCFNVKSEGAKELSKICNKNFKLIELDITKEDSVGSAVEFVEDYLFKHPEYELWALINNAGIMVFSEFEWQTERLIKQQLDVNLFGTMRVTKSFLPLLRKHSSRIITVTSHCANQTLPGLAVYGATKSGLAAWSDGLRVEVNKYGVKVITFIPGSFITQSNIMAQFNENVYEMQSAMTQEQTEFYGEYFRHYNAYLSALSGVRTPKKVSEEKLYETYEKALLEKDPKSCYVCESWRYTFYHTLFKISPVRLRDYLIVKFVQMPEWDRDSPIST